MANESATLALEHGSGVDVNVGVDVPDQLLLEVPLVEPRLRPKHGVDGSLGGGLLGRLRIHESEGGLSDGASCLLKLKLLVEALLIVHLLLIVLEHPLGPVLLLLLELTLPQLAGDLAVDGAQLTGLLLF
jgi:hypothetical protein